ncbi:MAG: hypothetical protein EB084_23230, partial [Proteobacteria bacterium]|nr:hypothetical protein [Pseudomonadota bacterium]
MEKQGIPLREITLFVEGIAPRERKVKRHTVNLGERNVDTKPEDVLDEAKGRLSMFKSVSSATLALNYIEVSSRDGARVKSFMLLDPRHIEYRIVQKQHGPAAPAAERTADEKAQSAKFAAERKAAMEAFDAEFKPTTTVGGIPAIVFGHVGDAKPPKPKADPMNMSEEEADRRVAEATAILDNPDATDADVERA